ncbi:MAG: hypothetical protein NUW37_16265 [Planctomycetes bacterium]|nr:hypothetical protein [Planctomycetota bacterium]
MKKNCYISLILAMVLAGAVEASAEVSLRDVARHWSPVFAIDVRKPQQRADIPVTVDFDGDMDPVNNWENQPTSELIPSVYGTTIETRTHVFLTYTCYYPRDWFRVRVISEHEHDFERVFVIVEKDATDFGRLILIETHPHGSPRDYSNVLEIARSNSSTGFAVEDHPWIYVHSQGHGSYADAENGVEVLFESGQMLERWNEAGFPDEDGLILSAAGEDEEVAEPSIEVMETTHEWKYRLVFVEDTEWWDRRDEVGPDALFPSYGRIRSDQNGPFVFPSGNSDTTDPLGRFQAVLESLGYENEIALEYEVNPYLCEVNVEFVDADTREPVNASYVLRATERAVLEGNGPEFTFRGDNRDYFLSATADGYESFSAPAEMWQYLQADEDVRGPGVRLWTVRLLKTSDEDF